MERPNKRNILLFNRKIREGKIMFKLKIYEKDFEKLCRGCTDTEIKEFIKKFNVEILKDE